MSAEGDRLAGGRTGRRRFPRLELDSELLVQDVTRGVTLEVRNISLGGFQALTALRVQTGDEHTIRVTLRGAPPVDLRARVVHCQPGVGVKAPYVAGWQFASDLATARGVAAIIDRLTDVESFDPAREPAGPSRPER